MTGATKLGATVLLSAAVSLAAAVGCSSVGVTTGQPAKRTLYMAAIEPKGSTTVQSEPFPTVPLPVGGGYILKAPDKDGRWEVSSYRWTPETLVVHQGDEITLEVVGINGAEHKTSIEGYDNVAFIVKRGQIATTTFTADKAGVFRILCATHLPSMTAQFVVLPRS